MSKRALIKCCLPMIFLWVVSCSSSGSPGSPGTPGTTCVAPQVLINGICTNPGNPGTTCSDSLKCGHESTCQSGTCQNQISTNCKDKSVCGGSQDCINSKCQQNTANSCTKDSDCTDTTETCQSNICKPQTTTSCKTNAPCIANGATNNTLCLIVAGAGTCGCSSAANCSAPTPVCNDAGKCAAAAGCTSDSDCAVNLGKTCQSIAGINQCAVKSCSGATQAAADAICPGISVCSGTAASSTCQAQTATHCRNATICSAGQQCTGATTPSCTTVSCTASSTCTGDQTIKSYNTTACISGICASNSCNGIGASTCTDTSQTCQSGQCKSPQIASSCRPGTGTLCAGGVACYPTSNCQCTSNASCLINNVQDVCSGSVCVQQTATNCFPGGTFCNISVLKNESCNSSGQCVCGTVAVNGIAPGPCSAGQTCTVNANGVGFCESSTKRYAFLTSNQYRPANPYQSPSGVFFGSVSDADAICQTEANHYGLGSDHWVALLGDAGHSAYGHLQSKSTNNSVDPTQPVYVPNNGPKISEGIPTTPTANCPAQHPGPFDCIALWQTSDSIPSNQIFWLSVGTDATIYSFQNFQEANCSNWIDIGLGQGVSGYTGTTGVKWWNGVPPNNNCATGNNLLCVEAD